MITTATSSLPNCTATSRQVLPSLLRAVTSQSCDKSNATAFASPCWQARWRAVLPSLSLAFTIDKGQDSNSCSTAAKQPAPAAWWRAVLRLISLQDASEPQRRRVMQTFLWSGNRDCVIYSSFRIMNTFTQSLDGPLDRPLTRSITHSLTHSLPPSLPHSLTHSLTHSLNHSLPPSLPPSLTHSLTHSFTHSLTHSLTYSLTHLLTHSLARSLAHSLIQSWLTTHDHSITRSLNT